MTIRFPAASAGSVTVPRNQQYSQVSPQVNPGSTPVNAHCATSSGVLCSFVRNASQAISPNGS